MWIGDDTLIFDYVKRWVARGTHAQPDPCAPSDGSWDNYGITYGPDGNGGCILDTDTSDGTGRFPELHGTSADGGSYGSAFANTMWDAYWGSVDIMVPEESQPEIPGKVILSFSRNPYNPTTEMVWIH